MDIKPYVDASISSFEQKDLDGLRNNLFLLIRNFNKPGSGQLITSFEQKDRLCECFTLCLRYDWMNDSDFREVWAENGFYCIVDYFTSHMNNQQDLLAASLDLFLLLHYGKDSLLPKFSDILNKAELRLNPIFSHEDYANGAEYLIRQFLFFASNILYPFAQKYNIISPTIKPYFLEAKNDTVFADISPEKIMYKMNFISRIIGSILDDM